MTHIAIQATNHTTELIKQLNIIKQPTTPSQVCKQHMCKPSKDMYASSTPYHKTRAPATSSPPQYIRKHHTTPHLDSPSGNRGSSSRSISSNNNKPHLDISRPQALHNEAGVHSARGHVLLPATGRPVPQHLDQEARELADDGGLALEHLKRPRNCHQTLVKRRFTALICAVLADA